MKEDLEQLVLFVMKKCGSKHANYGYANYQLKQTI